MKLSKAQQEVVDKMREGWELKETAVGTWLQHKVLCPTRTVICTTQIALFKKGIIYLHATNQSSRIYQLTEKYRNNEE